MTAIPTDSQDRSPFRAAVESKDLDAVLATLAPDVHFRSPVVFSAYEGRDSVGALLRLVAEVLGPQLRYQWQARDGEREVLCFSSRIGDREIEGVDILRYDSDGRVAELVVMVRPASAMLALRDAMGEKLKALAAQAT
jgi:limonene-1,2-epoxide hydrolase